MTHQTEADSIWKNFSVRLFLEALICGALSTFFGVLYAVFAIASLAFDSPEMSLLALIAVFPVAEYWHLSLLTCAGKVYHFRWYSYAALVCALAISITLVAMAPGFAVVVGPPFLVIIHFVQLQLKASRAAK